MSLVKGEVAPVDLSFRSPGKNILGVYSLGMRLSGYKSGLSVVTNRNGEFFFFGI